MGRLQRRTSVEWKSAARADGSSFVSISGSGWTGTADALLHYVAESTQGFTWTLAGLKAWLEHGMHLELVRDPYPDAASVPFPDS